MKWFLLILAVTLVAVVSIIWMQDKYSCTEYDNRDDCVLKFIDDRQVKDDEVCK